MTATPPDPDPAQTPGLEPGGGVAPGDTPPDSGQTSGVSPDQPIPPRSRNIVALVIVTILTLMVLGFVVAQIMGWAKLF
ncbi:hypothetical protein FHS29_006884 [Saccharothrix tamanrassetensis]|uniref:Uncharacterized protein n=1 Tax=Saccharothrix tamanrassetensis TaxID=1051531 RepID=A0A841CRB2_9PSEU|nr:DUF6480 family protein [Saccharothrix tamanrassetensis]MBB5960261.1 hypothetical protein [Saccharothrix tamanrassetensis]